MSSGLCPLPFAAVASPRAPRSSLYGVENRRFLQAVRRNVERFPADFMFQLTLAEAETGETASEIVARAGPVARGKNTKYLPYAFTEQGVAMLSSVLLSPRAIEVNIEIMRAFVRYGNCSPSTRTWRRGSKSWNGATTLSSESCSTPFAS